MSLPLDLEERIIPPRGSVLIRRDERPCVSRGIWIPERARQASRAAMATVVKTGRGVAELSAGDRVLLAATVGSRQIRLGERGELTLEVCRPSQILAVLEEDVNEVAHRGEQPLARFAPGVVEGYTETAPDEGEPTARC